MLGIDHSLAKKLRDNIHEHSIACADKLMKSRRMLERSCHGQNRKGLGLTPHRSLGEVTPPLRLLSQDSGFGLPLGLEAPVMTPNGVNFLFFSFP